MVIILCICVWIRAFCNCGVKKTREKEVCVCARARVHAEGETTAGAGLSKNGFGCLWHLSLGNCKDGEGVGGDVGFPAVDSAVPGPSVRVGLSEEALAYVSAQVKRVGPEGRQMPMPRSVLGLGISARSSCWPREGAVVEEKLERPDAHDRSIIHWHLTCSAWSSDQGH